MIKPEQVPDEVVVALATSMGWQSSVSDLRGVDQMKKHVAAAINAWPSMHEARSDRLLGCQIIILPLPQEVSND